MTLTNHLFTGSLMAKVLPLPVALPLAFASHFVLDALPHFGFVDIDDYEVRRRHKRLLMCVVTVDFLLAVALTFWLVGSGHGKWLIAGLAAFSPDVIWIYRFVVDEKFGKLEPPEGGRFVKFHAGIQRFERIWGGGVEVAYAAGMFMLLK